MKSLEVVVGVFEDVECRDDLERFVVERQFFHR